MRASLTVGFLAALGSSFAGAARDPGCGSAGEPDGAMNAPCTRARDCADGLTCIEGVCTTADAGAADTGPTGDAAPTD